MLRELSKLTGLSTDDLKARYEGREPTWFFPIKDFPEERGEELLTTIAKLPGAVVQPATARVYPLGEAAAHVTGYVTEVTAEQIEADPSLVPGQIVGQAGIEAGADELLTGQPGGRLVVVQCDTRAERSTIAERPPTPAKDLVLTIDRELQLAVDAALTAQGDVKGQRRRARPPDRRRAGAGQPPQLRPERLRPRFLEQDQQAIDERESPAAAQPRRPGRLPDRLDLQGDHLGRGDGGPRLHRRHGLRLPVVLSRSKARTRSGRTGRLPRGWGRRDR